MIRIAKAGAAVGLAVGLLTTAGPTAAKLGSCDEPITLGTTISSTGQYSTLAERWREMTEIFGDEINKGGGVMVRACNKKLPVKFVIYDDQSIPTTAVTLYEKMASVDQVDFFVGPDWSAFGFPVPPIAEKHQIPMVMSNVAAPPIFQRGLKYMWGTPIPTVPNWDTRYFDMISKQNPKPQTFYFVTQDNPITKALTEYWSKKAEELGYKVLGSEVFSTQLKDFTPLILKMRAARPDIVYISSFDIPSAPLIQQMRQLKVKAMDVHHTILSGALSRQIGKDLEGVTGMLPWYPGVKGDYDAFAERVLERSKIDAFEYPYTMSRIAAYLIMVQAIEKAGEVDREKVRAALYKGTFKSPIGDIVFDEGGYAFKNGAFQMQMQNGKVVIVWPPDLATGKVVWPSPTWQ
jgi:ABC-type branched-subunit amino acid transport system substrate-binding protein